MSKHDGTQGFNLSVVFADVLTKLFKLMTLLRVTKFTKIPNILKQNSVEITMDFSVFVFHIVPD